MATRAIFVLYVLGLFASHASAQVVVNEVATSGDDTNVVCDEDFIELFNPSSGDVTITGLVVSDDHGHNYDSQLVLGAGSCQGTMPAGSYLLLCRNGAATLYSGVGAVVSTEGGCGHTFGMGSSDMANLYASVSDSTLISSSVSSASPSTSSTSSWSRASVDGTGTFLTTNVRTPGSKNVYLTINEIATTGNPSDACGGEDWIELYNPTAATVSLVGLQLTDDHNLPYSKSLTLGQGSCPTTLAAGQYMLFCGDVGNALVGSAGSAATTTASCGIDFGLGGTDTAQLFDANGLLIDTTGAAPGSQSETVTFGRNNGVGGFYLMTPTPLATNEAPAGGTLSPPPPPTWLVQGHPDFRPIVINEVADKEDANDICAGVDWVELHNPTSSAESLVGLVLVDDKGHGHSDQLVLGQGSCPTTLAAGGYLVLCKEGPAWVGTATSYPGCGFNFGIGSGDTLTLFLNATHDHYLDTTPGCCANSDLRSFGLASVDGSGDHTTLQIRTPGVQNIWTVVINEVATTGNSADACAGEDYVELYNPLDAAVDITGWQLTDDHGLPYSKSLTLGAAGCPTSLNAGAFLLLCKESAATVFDGNITTPYATSCSFEFGVGGSDTVQASTALYQPDGTTLIDTSGHLGSLGSSVQSQGRPTIGTAYDVMSRTPGAANIAALVVASPPPSPSSPPAVFPPLLPSAVKINEVAATGNNDDLCAGADWIELWNPTAAAASIVDMVLVDDKGHDHSDRHVLGSSACPQSLGADQYLVLCKEGEVTLWSAGTVQQTWAATSNCGFEYGVGDGDTINLFLNKNDNTSLADTTPYCCSNSGQLSFGRTSHDGTGAFTLTPRTPGLKNYQDPPPPPSPVGPPPPSVPPGSTTAVVVTVVAELDLTLSEFDDAAQTSYKTNLASTAGVTVSDITLNITSGSIVVTATISTPSAAVASAVSSAISAAIATTATTNVFMGVTVAATPAQPVISNAVLAAPPPSPAFPEGSGGSSLGTGATIGIVLGCIVGGALVFAGAFLAFGPKSKATVTLSTPTPVEMQTEMKTGAKQESSV